MWRRRSILLSAVTAVVIGSYCAGPYAGRIGRAAWQAFLAAASSDPQQAQAALADIAARWRDGYAAMIVDVVRFLPSPRANRTADEGAFAGLRRCDGRAAAGRHAGPDDFPPMVRSSPGADTRRRLTTFLERQTRQRFGDDLRAWRKWMWALPDSPHPDYASFKAELYSRIDPQFRAFFPPRVRSTIRLDEIDWGGVTVNGIPPLRSPKTIPAADATWLRDGHIVFGIIINGQARAYPKRILAWHEMAIDRVGGVDLTIVYCTLCGTVIPYESGVSGRRLTFGTSGLLYRSNKLMFDEETRSLWSSLEGVPVVGTLVDSGLQLPFRSVVTTTWGEWKRDHPTTTVLSLETGYERELRRGRGVSRLLCNRSSDVRSATHRHATQEQSRSPGATPRDHREECVAGRHRGGAVATRARVRVRGRRASLRRHHVERPARTCCSSAARTRLSHTPRWRAPRHDGPAMERDG